MNFKNITKITFSLLLTGSAYAKESIFLYNNYLNINNESSKNAIMVGATTATAKGYSAILTNPAGLSTHANTALYVKTTMTQTVADNNEKITATKPANQLTFGAIYNSYVIEYKLDDYIAMGAGYGYESRYGLFSVGASYLYDTTQRTTVENAQNAKETSNDEYATGNYNVIGFMWQKTFITQDRFYGIYLGMSRKSSGKYDGNSGNPNIIPISPLKVSYGLGLETNVLGRSVLVTMDYFKESWLSHSETRSGMAYGAKILLANKFSIGGGMSNQTNSQNRLGDIKTIGGGIEYSIFNLHFNGSYLKRTLNLANGDLYLTDDSAHLDVAISF